jgi:Spy/CpxP family protein refolding chaperone
MKKTAITLLLTLGLGTALLAMEPCDHSQNHKGQRGGIFKLIKQLDLTPEQRDEFKALKTSRKEMMQGKKEERKKHRQSMQGKMKPNMGNFMTADKFDKAAFIEEMKKKQKIMQETMKARQASMLQRRADGMEKVFNILTPKQRLELIELTKIK